MDIRNRRSAMTCCSTALTPCQSPFAMAIRNEHLIYFDRYQAAGRGYGAVWSTDLSIWENVNAQVSFPEGARHGTVIAVPTAVIQTLYNAP